MTIAIVEDDPLAAGILKEYLEGGDMHVIAVYGSGEEALERIALLPLPDIVLMDIGLPGMSGIEAMSALKDRYPDIHVVVQTIFEDADTIMKAIRAGASGYILKASTREEILDALREVRSGGSPLSGKIAKKILDECRREEPLGSSGRRRKFDLTPRESSILESLIGGESCKCIAADLCISIHTVNNHLRNIYEKMRVNSRSEAVARAIGR